MIRRVRAKKTPRQDVPAAAWRVANTGEAVRVRVETEIFGGDSAASQSAGSGGLRQPRVDGCKAYGAIATLDPLRCARRRPACA